MLYIHRMNCISPQQTFGTVDLEQLRPSVDNQLTVLDPSYEGIPPGMLRRMGKAIKISVGSAMALVKDVPRPSGIIIGSGNGGLEDCVKFLDQIVEYEEGMLTPASFVQSTANAMAGQISMLTRNQGYNITHVHRGLAFENALLDAVMFGAETPNETFLLGGVEEISTYNNNIETLAGTFKSEPASSLELYTSQTPGSLPGEGAAMFLVSGKKGEGTLATISALETVHSDNTDVVQSRLALFMNRHIPGGPDLLLTGESGDIRYKALYEAIEGGFARDTGIARFKHMSGEHPVASAIGTWIACHLVSGGSLPGHMVKRPASVPGFRNILLYNNYKGSQHSFILVSVVND